MSRVEAETSAERASAFTSTTYDPHSSVGQEKSHTSGGPEHRDDTAQWPVPLLPRWRA